MLAGVLHKPGAVEAIQLDRVPFLTPKSGQVLIRVKAFGINRSELLTRMGVMLMGVSLPRVLGIEAVGVIEDAPDSAELKKGDVVATCMGGMGRMFDGGYAEYTCVPATQVVHLPSFTADTAPWPVLGALPEMTQTAWGSLFTCLRLHPRDSLLIRGGTTSVGLMAAALAKRHGCHVAATTRSASREALLKANGVDEIYVDDGAIAAQVRSRYPVEDKPNPEGFPQPYHRGYDKVLEMVGCGTLVDSIACAGPNAIVCVTGTTGGKFALENFNPIFGLPNSVALTGYSGSVGQFAQTPLDEVARLVVDGKLTVSTKVLHGLDKVHEAHRLMQEDEAGGKMVVVV